MHASLKLSLIIPSLLISACSTQPSAPIEINQTIQMPSSSLIQSQNDNREYENFTLDNQLNVLIISDPDTDKAAASLDVFVGSASDPKDRAGLAHFLEHMLFLGTEKYPDPDEYQAFISQHGGSRNAYTAKEHTNYFFDIENSALEPMLDRFSQFFSAPLFNPEFVEREKNAVHSEYLGKIKTDGRRFYAAMQQAFNPESPYAQFSVGSLDTLADRPNQTVHQDLLKFYKQYYSANLMRLVVLANEPLPTLKKWVTAKFANIPNNNAQQKTFQQPLLTTAQMAKRIDIQSLQTKRELSLNFPLSPTQAHYRLKPSLYFQSLLGHEGEGSILALLKAQGWADELSASSGFSDNAQESSLYLSLNLTETGLAHVDDIIDTVFQYIRLLQTSGIQQAFYQEQKQMTDLHFRYQEKQGASHTVTKLARDLHYYAPEDILRGGSMMTEFKPDLIQALLDQLTPERVLIALNSDSVQGEQREQNYHVDYTITPISEQQRQRWSSSAINPALKLPTANPFIPDALNLKANTVNHQHPEQFINDATFTAWHQLDTSFNVPRNGLYLALHSPIANDNPRHHLLTSLLSGVINKQLNSYAYPARLAGLNYSIYPTERGISLSLSGYDAKQALLLEQLLKAVKQPDITAERFTVLKQRFQQTLQNAKKQQPFQQLLGEVKRSLVENRWTTEQKLAALDSLTQTDLEQFATQFLQSLHLTFLSHGNQTRHEAEKTALAIKQQFNLAAKIPATRVMQLPKNSIHTRQLDIDHHDASLALYFQAPDKSIQSQAYSHLLGRIIGSEFFADLRTKQQLGYNLAAAALPIKEVGGVLFILQSPVISAPEIEKRINTFIQAFPTELDKLTVAELETYKTGLITRLLEKDKSLQKRSAKYWLEIDRENFEFNTPERIANAVKTIDKTQLLNTYQDWFINHPQLFRSYALGTQFAKDDFTDKHLIIDTDAFKAQLKTW